MRRFERLFAPRAIAVVGVSEDAVRPGSQAVHTLLRYGYEGRIYPVNPRYSEFAGLRCYPSIAAIDGEIDVVVIGVPSRAVLPVIEECAARRVGYAVVLSGGFRESGPEGAALQERMVETARAAGMRIVGPNCLGLANVQNNVYAAFGSITRTPKLANGPVSLVTQSGGFGYSIALACAAEGIGFRNVIATGNEADIDTIEFIEGLLDDERTGIILAYIEGLPDGRKLLEAGRRALSVGKPILVWKGGVTEQGARAAASHTANMTGSYDLYQALFKQSGIVEITEIHEAVDYIKGFLSGKFPAGRRVAVMGGSGGSAIVFADAAERADLTLSTLTEHTKSELSKVVPAIGSVENPVDFTAGYIQGGNAGKFEIAVRSVLEDPGVDGVCVNFATVGGAPCLAGAEVLARLTAQTHKPLVAFLSVPPEETGGALPVFRGAGVPVLPSPGRAARVLAMLANYVDARERNSTAQSVPAGEPIRVPAGVLRERRGHALSEAESKVLLARAGIAVTNEWVVQSTDEARLGGLKVPLVVKIASPDIPHKTEIGGVKLGIRTQDELRAAVAEVLENARAKAPAARIEGALVGEMVTEGFELIAGALNDAVFGPVVIVGAGGIYAEALRDKTCRIAPFDEDTAREMLNELRCSTILRGARGKPPLDTNALARALAALSRFAWDNRETIAEIDVNPIFALPEGAVAADALVVLRA
jgi:acetate---CoA ligase (ADP-forming)